MNPVEHPLGQHFAWVAAGARPSRADIDTLVAEVLAPDSRVQEAVLRRELNDAARRIHEALEDGAYGQARSIGAEAAAVLASALGALPHIDRDAGRTVRDIIDRDVPR